MVEQHNYLDDIVLKRRSSLIVKAIYGSTAQLSK